MATKFNIIVNENYYCAYIPSAHSQKYAFDKVEGKIKVSMPSVTADEAPVAFRITAYSYREKGKTEMRWYDGKLWKRCVMDDFVCQGGKEGVSPEYFALHCRPNLPSSGLSRSRDVCVRAYRNYYQDYILIDGEIWSRAGEPRYVVNTFGLGHNHGGTGMFVEEFYNNNIPNTNYFSALDGDAAIAYANKVVTRRGDTESVGRFEKMIEVLIPEAVSIRPMQEHGDGDPFINKINAVTELAPDSSTAGILAMMAAVKEIGK